MNGKQASQINNLCAESRHFNGRHNNVRWKSQTMIIFHKASFTASSQKRTEQTCFCEQALLLTGCFPLAFKRNDWKRETFYSSSSTLSPSVKKKAKWQNHQANTKQTVVFAGQLRIVLLKIGFENIGCRWKKKKHMAVSLFSQTAPVVGSICQASKTKRLRWASQLLPAAERGRVRIDGRVGEKM